MSSLQGTAGVWFAECCWGDCMRGFAGSLRGRPGERAGGGVSSDGRGSSPDHPTPHRAGGVLWFRRPCVMPAAVGV
eukprot:1485622-Pyramimonas_sp.AAC.1